MLNDISSIYSCKLLTLYIPSITLCSSSKSRDFIKNSSSRRKVQPYRRILWKTLHVWIKKVIGYQTLAGEFCIVNREFSDLWCLMKTLKSLLEIPQCNLNMYGTSFKASSASACFSSSSAFSFIISSLCFSICPTVSFSFDRLSSNLVLSSFCCLSWNQWP